MENKETEERLNKLQKDNKELNTNLLFIKKDYQKVEVEDHFDDDIGKP